MPAPPKASIGNRPKEKRVSANSFFSLLFSSSSTFRRLASDTSRPPYLAFHL
jgi:hypothetical protein